MNAEEFKAAVEAVDLTAVDATAQILALNTGLMDSNTILLTESKANKTKAQEALEATETANNAVIEAEKLRLEQANDMDGLKKLHATETAKAVAKEKSLTDQATNALSARDKGDVISQVLADIDPRYHQFVRTQLQSSVSISYDESGKAIANIQDGDANYASSKDFIDGVKESDAWKHVIKATSLSGAGTEQSTGKLPGSKNTVQSKLAGRLKAQGLTQ